MSEDDNIKPPLTQRLTSCTKSFFKEGMDGALMGAAVGFLFGTALAGAAAAGLVAAPTLVAGGILATGLHFAGFSALFGAVSHAVLGATETFINSGRTGKEGEEHDHEKTHVKEQEKGRGQAVQKATDGPDMDLQPIPNFRERIERQRELAAQHQHR